MSFCQECGSSRVRKKGTVERMDGLHQRYLCRDCGNNTYVEIVDDEEIVAKKQGDLFRLPKEEKEEAESKNIYVITCAQNDTPINTEFFKSLIKYCEVRGADLKIIPTRYRNPSAMHSVSSYKWPTAIKPFLTDDQLELSNHIKIMGNLQIQATATSPLSGLHRLSRGKSVIIGHPKIEMLTLPVNKHQHPIVFSTTGTISEKNYSDTKAGIKGEYSHNTSAIVVEVDRDNDKFHIRHLMAGDDGSFYDLDRHYTPEGFTEIDQVKALVCGDEHVLFMEPTVKENTFTNKDSMLNRLRPEYIVRHDVVDCYTVSHHHRKDKFLQYHKYINGMNDLKEELVLTCDHMVQTTPDWAKTVMVESNHHNHITQFLNEANPDNEPWNAVLYHELKYRMLQHIDENNEIGNPFKLWFEANYENDKGRFIWLEDEIPLYIGPWNVSNHGHLGPNGSRGSRQSISKVPEPSIIGHSHGPGIKDDCVQVGTSSKRKQGWNAGPSDWAACHAIIHQNDKVQLIFVTDGDYYLKEE